MEKKKENILAAIIFVGLISHYVFGYFFWDKLGSDRIYSITAYFCMDLYGFLVYLLSKGKILKGMGALGMLLGTYYFYMEFQEPYLWVSRDYLTLALTLVNIFFIWFFTEKFKNKTIK